MLKAFRTSVLLLVLVCSAQAGEILTPPAPQPPPPQPTMTEQEPEGGEIHNPQATQETAIQVGLTLLQSVLSLL